MLTEYDASFVARDNNPDRWARYGQVWTEDEREDLRGMFTRSTQDLETLCIQLGRPPSGVLAKLVDMKLLAREVARYGSYSYRYFFRYTPKPALVTPRVQPKKEKPEMTDITLTTKTLIGGVDSADITDDNIFAMIARKEDEIRKLETINNKPKKLEKQIEKAKAEIAALVAFVDAR